MFVPRQRARGRVSGSAPADKYSEYDLALCIVYTALHVQSRDEEIFSGVISGRSIVCVTWRILCWAGRKETRLFLKSHTTHKIIFCRGITVFQEQTPHTLNV